ncbi:MAG: ectoine hydroxylase [Candidatus Nitronauta litoralis]|uniref:Ectoine hydroxylase n=1 Tax=Candidatus Nitronauta litoralis TaxID=2705533 RepID=A0A7T0BU52_9BACT|nr:MAG: ectoine hydroxylase [Candidatus Nitronauta litoralis]
MTQQATLQDKYPSRGDVPGILDRKDPVIYGSSSSGPDAYLDNEQLSFYEKNGYLILESFFFREEVEKLQEELNCLRSAEGVEENPEYILEPSSREVRSIFNIHRTNELFSKLSRDKLILKIVTQLLNSPVYIHQSRINYKPGFDGKEFYWHSDFETWHVEDGMPRMRAISCSITLTDNNEFNGPLLLIPGSHQQFISCAGQTPENHFKQSLKKQEYGVPDSRILKRIADQNGMVSFKGNAGSVVFFECNVMHGSNGNITPWPRSNIFFVYNSMENTLVEPFCGLKPRPDYIASREFSPLEPE